MTTTPPETICTKKSEVLGLKTYVGAQMSRRVYPKHVAYHEAGHAAVHLCLLGPIWGVHVAPRGQKTITDRKGREIACVGLFEGDTFSLHRLGIAVSQIEPACAHARAHMIINLAGPLAEAHYRRQSAISCLLFGGKRDWEDTKALAAWLYPDEPDNVSKALVDAEAMARKLVKKEWPLIIAIADVLVEHGYIDGEHELFAQRGRQDPRTAQL